ncbi:MAG: hypothetical protein ACRDTG_20350 [Pseudonocardiaceae bacterium]
MAQLPDVHGWIKIIESRVGKVRPSGTVFDGQQGVILRYSFANDSHQITGPLTVVGTLFRDDVRVQPPGKSNVVPAQQITLQPGQIWSKEHRVLEVNPGDPHFYVASLLSDVENLIDEEDESNNEAKITFSFQRPPD